MNRPVQPFEGKPFTLCSEETRWFAHRLFGACAGAEGGAEAGAPGWRSGAPSPKKAA